jgi:peptidoglycan/LPS O-acetylase OafA/YrhL
MASPPYGARERSIALDLLRFAAVWLVLVRHMHVPPHDVAPWVTGLLQVAARGGWVGVDLFFVLSGFLVSGLLFREHARTGRIAVRHFLVRRGLKIYPSFYLLIGLTVLQGVLGLRTLGVETVLREVFFLQNYGAGGLWNHTWSLAVEEHFYITLPLLLLLLIRWGPEAVGGDPFSRILSVFWVVALGALAARVYTTATTPFSWYTHMEPTHLRIDSLMFGVLLSYYYHRSRAEFERFARTYRGPLLAGGAALFAPAFVLELGHPYLHTFGLTFLYVGAGMVLVAFLGIEFPNNALARSTAFLGARSYSIYLWPMPVSGWLVPILASFFPVFHEWPVIALTDLLGALVVGVVASELIEVPVLAFRDRYFPSRAAVGVPPSGALVAAAPAPSPSA